ncbi:MAG TPA: glycosyltransferase [Thermoanaerobaculia bacterium]|nr:glycosyltransferase [Thermoanaerobaculia bacterium]
MRILLAIHNAYTDSESGAAHSIRILMRWLAEAGHECRVLGTARFDARAPELDAHLAGLGVEVARRRPERGFIRSVRKPANVAAGRPTAHFTLAGAPVTMLLTKHNDASRPDRLESEQFLFLLDRELRDFKPDVVLSYGGHPVLREAMPRARDGGAVTVFTLRNHGYEDARHYENVDHVFTTSPYLSEQYRRRIGLVSAGIPSPIDWSEVLATEAERRFVTFVNPSAHKGAGVFARIADMLGSSRPDIPILVVQSASSAGVLNAIPGIDFAKYPQILAAPPLRKPADFFALTRLLLVPSLFEEPFGRVAAEAMVNGIPPLVSDRGGLPETVAGAGRVLSLPERLTGKSLEVPGAEEVRPWVETVCELWDDPAKYTSESQRARAAAERLYGEAALRRQYLDYFTEALRVGRGRALFERAK